MMQPRLIARADLLASGLSRGRVDSLVRSGRLEVIHRGQYLDSNPPEVEAELSIDIDRARAHLDACGSGSALSHHTAAALHGFDSTAKRPTELYVTAPRGSGIRSRPGLVVRRPVWAPEVAELQGLLVTSRAQTVLDLAAILEPLELRRIVESALRGPIPTRPDQWRLDVLLELDRLVSERPRHRGATPVIRMLADRPNDRRPTGSFAETVLVQALELLGIEVITQPTVTVHDSRGGVNRYFPDALLIAGQALIEVDGAEHREATRFARDIERQNRLVGFHIFRFTAQQVIRDTASAVAELRRHLDLNPPQGTTWVSGGRVVQGSGNEWTIRPAR
jgi:very-short-patch-repair endonuclease